MNGEIDIANTNNLIQLRHIISLNPYICRKFIIDVVNQHMHIITNGTIVVTSLQYAI
jgi:hypothetical protein